MKAAFLVAFLVSLQDAGFLKIVLNRNSPKKGSVKFYFSGDCFTHFSPVILGKHK